MFGLVVLVLAAGGATGWATWQARVRHSVASRLEAALRSGLTGAGRLEVRVSVRSPLSLLSGWIDRLEVDGSDVVIDTLRAERLTVFGDGLRIDTGQLARQRRLVVQSARQLQVEAVISEPALNEYLRQQTPLASLVQVRLQAGGPRLELSAEVSGRPVRVLLEGRIVVQDHNTLAVVPDRLSIAQGDQEALALPLAGAGDGVLKVPVPPWPVPVTLDGVEVGDGVVVVRGRFDPAAAGMSPGHGAAIPEPVTVREPAAIPGGGPLDEPGRAME